MLEPNFASTCQKLCMLLMFLEVVAVVVWFYMFCFKIHAFLRVFYDMLEQFWKHVGAILEPRFDEDYVQRVCLWSF